MVRLRFVLCLAVLAGCGSDTISGQNQEGDGDSRGYGDGDDDGDGDGDGDRANEDEDDNKGDEEGDGDRRGDGDDDAGDGDEGDGDGGDGDGGDGDVGSAPGGKPDPSTLPKVNGTCPTLKDGTISIGGASVKIWVGSKPGPVYLYFHGTGSTPGEIEQGVPGATSSVKTEGGIAASWDTSNGKGTNTGTIWYTGDMEAADQLIACGIAANLVDTARIHVAGYSAGGLETGAFVFGRSNYVASVIVYSGGKPFGVTGTLGGGKHVPSMVGAHGKVGSDVVVIDFGTATPKLGQDIVNAGGFAIDCDDGGGHVNLGRLGLGGKARTFFQDHPWGVKGYEGGIPSGWPGHCKILK